MGSNPFVNPNQRGVELPAGCKDLMDVLKKEGRVGRANGRQKLWYGDLSEIERRVKTYLQSAVVGWWLAVGIPKRRIFVILLKHEDGLTLNICAPEKHESVVRRIFHPNIGKSFDGREYVTVALDPGKQAIAKMMLELLVEGFGVGIEQLMFISYEAADRKGEG